MGEVMFGMAIFFGLWLSWTVGYHVNDWVRKLFSYRMRATDTRVEFTPATPVEIEQKLDYFENPFTCRICGMQDLNGTHAHPAKEEIDQKVREVDYYGGNPPAWRTGVVKEDVDGSRSYFTEDMLKEKEEAGDLEDILSGMSPDQRDLFYLTMKFALEEMIEEQEEINTFGDNLKFVAPRRTPPYTHLDL